MIRFMEGILLRKAAEDVARVLSGAGHTVYFVGGCVRDRLLGYSVKDIDIATSARPDEVLRLFPDAWEVGAAFGVVLCLITVAAMALINLIFPKEKYEM